MATTPTSAVGGPDADIASRAMGRYGGGGTGLARPMYQGSSSGKTWCIPRRVVDKTSSTAGQSSPLCCLTSAR